MLTMIAILLFIFFTLSNATLTPLKRNLAYRSPSLTVSGSGLSHDIESIGNQIIRKSILNRRSSSKQDENDTIESALNGNAANEMVLNYNSDKGIDGQDSYQGNLSFPFNVASGDPYFNSIILWTHPVPQDNQTQQPICLRYEVSKSLNDFQKKYIVDYGYAWTTIDVDYSFKVEATNLNPLTSYSYRFFACHDHSQISQIGYFKTLPKYDDDQVDKLKIAVFSCSNLPFGYFNAYRIASQMEDLDYAMHVGDYLYESQGDGSNNSYGDGRPLNRVPLPNKEIFTLNDYRLRYKSYRSDKDLQALHQNKAALLVWDDHESLGDIGLEDQ